MKSDKQKNNLVIDIILFAGFILCFFLELTGVIVHQWLGVAMCGMAVIHLLLHDAWVKNLLRRFSDLHTRPQILFLLDAAIALGFLGILVTGLVVSTWLNLSLTSISGWMDVHTAFSIETLFFLLVKVGFHWRWISNAFHSLFGKKPAALPVPQTAVRNPSLTPVPQPAGKQISRRDFLAVMGVAGFASYLAVSTLLKDNQVVASAQSIIETATSTASPTTASTSVQAASTAAPAASSTATSLPTATPVSTQAVSYSCTVRCNRGCSYPGGCHRYVDSNGNGKCDNGECL
jgi:hypothetical protein